MCGPASGDIMGREMTEVEKTAASCAGFFLRADASTSRSWPRAFGAAVVSTARIPATEHCSQSDGAGAASGASPEAVLVR
jgi:hypothetical protein